MSEDSDQLAKVPVDSIGKAKPETVSSSDSLLNGRDPLTGKKTYDKELGWVGKVIGGSAEKPGNIVFVTIVFCGAVAASGFVATFFVEDAIRANRIDNIVALAFSTASAGLGYVFGKSSSGDDS